MKEKLPLNLVVCGLVRNAAQNLERNLDRFELLKPFFESFKVIIYENDSTDNTKEILKRYGERTKSDATILMADFKEYPFQFGPFSKHRVDLMSKYRNQYLDKLKEFPETDYVLLIDLDVYDFSIESILNCFKVEFKWDMVSAFGVNFVDYKLFPVFYDIYAYTEEDNTKHHFSDFREFREEQRELYRKYNNTKEWVQITSNFNGLAIYTYKSLMCGARYNSAPCTQEGIESFCEHVVFNNTLINKGYSKLYLSPELKITYEKKKNLRHLKGYVKYTSLGVAKKIYVILRKYIKSAN